MDYHDRVVRVIDRLKVSPGPVRLAVLGRRRIVRRGVALVATAHICFGREGHCRCRARNLATSAISSCRFARESWLARRRL